MDEYNNELGVIMVGDVYWLKRYAGTTEREYEAHRYTRQEWKDLPADTRELTRFIPDEA